MNRTEELEKQIKNLQEENDKLKRTIIRLQDEARPRCSGCGDILDGPHHSFYDDSR